MKKQIKAALAIGAMVLATSGEAAAGEQAGSAHAFSFTSIDETAPINMQDYAGKVVLVVNTASFCGFTKQYNGLQALWQSYKDRGLVVLGVPSNDFGGQEPKAEGEILDFCQGAFGVTFPLTEKVHVKGPRAHPLYRWAADITRGRAVPQWNFHKLLIGGDGRLIEWHTSRVRPQSATLTRAIEKELARLESKRS